MKKVVCGVGAVLVAFFLGRLSAQDVVLLGFTLRSIASEAAPCTTIRDSWTSSVYALP